MEEDTFKEQLAKNIKKLRETKGYTQEELAKLIGVGRSAIANIEANIGTKTKLKKKKGRKGNLFTLDKLPKYLKALECTPKDLLSPLFSDTLEDKDLLEIIEKVKKIYKIPEGREELKKELHKIELMLKDMENRKI